MSISYSFRGETRAGAREKSPASTAGLVWLRDDKPCVLEGEQLYGIQGRTIVSPTNIFLASMPKAGTYLLRAVIENLVGRRVLPVSKNDFTLGRFDHVRAVVENFGYRDFLFFGHVRRASTEYLATSPQVIAYSDYLATSPHWRVIALIRDPRDVALSMLDFIGTSKTAVHQEAFSQIAHMDRREQIKAIVKGIILRPDDDLYFRILPIKDHCTGWIEWAETGALLLGYEDFHSGLAAARLADFLSVPLAAAEQACRDALHAKTPTRNRAEPNRWKSKFDAELAAFFKANDGGIVERLGYSWGDA